MSRPHKAKAPAQAPSACSGDPVGRPEREPGGQAGQPSRVRALLGTSVQQWVRWLVPFGIALVTLIVFLPTLRNEFVDWDDLKLLLENFYYRGLGWSQLRWMVTTSLMGHWIPLTWVTFGMDFLVWGMDPFGYHLTNLLLHTSNAIVLYLVALRLLGLTMAGLDEITLRIGAGAAALFFAIHPLRVESVAWATERRDVLSGLFFLLTIQSYLKASGADGALRRRWLACSVGCYAAALMSKSMVMTLPFTLILLDIYPLGRLGKRWGEWSAPGTRRVLAEKVPYLLLALVGASVAFYAHAAGATMTPLETLPVSARVPITLSSLWFYVWKTLIPLGLSPLYELPAKVNLLAAPFLVSALAVGVITAGLLLLRRRWPAGLASWAYYVVTLGPVSGIVHSGPQLTADRYSYLPCLGWALLVGAGVGAVARARARETLGQPWAFWAAAAAAVWFSGLGVITWRQVQVWHDSETLWTHALSLDPDSSFAHNALGHVFLTEGKLSEAREQFQQALRLNPNFERATVNLGVTLISQGNVGEAIELYQRALQINPGFAEVHTNLGVVLARQGRLSEAIEHYEQAMRLHPTIAEAHFNLGTALLGQGKLNEAIEHFQQALQINPNYRKARRMLDAALTRKGE
jgi:tetratricopeptide (TPR) repeat protein